MEGRDRLYQVWITDYIQNKDFLPTNMLKKFGIPTKFDVIYVDVKIIGNCIFNRSRTD